MNKKIICIFIIGILLTTFSSAIPSKFISQNPSNNEPETEERSFSHNILGEYFTWTTCVPCKYAHTALKYLYENKTNWNLPFYYITYVYNVNNNSRDRSIELDIQKTPTVAWDGGWKIDASQVTSTEEEMEKYNISIIAAGNRNVKDIDLSLDVEWLGAVNNVPENGSTDVPVEKIMRWNNSEFKIDVEVVCNETDQYNGHLHVQVTEVNSTWWDDKFGKPYTFEFKNYAYNDDVTFSGSGTWNNTIYWDGCDYHDRDDPPRYFNHITQDNIMIIATMFDEDNNNYVDETTGFRAGDETDPKLYDIYFGTTNPPPQKQWNFSMTNYWNGSDLEFDTTYYWKVDTWDQKDNVVKGNIWSFTTRGNEPPYEPNSPSPWNGSINQPILMNLSWKGGDPDGDNVTYDVYFGEHPMNLSKRVTNQSHLWWKPPLLNFQKTYFWQIIAWDQYGYESVGPVWHFTTEPNYPPDKAFNPFPEDGESVVPIDVIVAWNGSDPNIGDSIKFDVYFDDVYPPVQRTFNQTENFYDPYGQQNLSLYKTYYWKIVTWDSKGLSSVGDIWNFTTGLNHKPTNPQINGPNKGTINIEYEFTFVSTDQDNHTIKYYIDWDDEDSIETEYYESGEVVKLSHSWEEEGTYFIKARAEDKLHTKSEDWSEFQFKAPRNKVLNYKLLEILFERFPYLYLLFENLLKIF